MSREYVLTDHATLEMMRRGLGTSLIRQVLDRPEQRIQVRPGRDILQSKLDMEGKTYLVRVVVDVDRTPAEVVTVYRTSKIEKYWRKDT